MAASEGSSIRRYDVCAAVVGHLPFDARVWKEARSLAGAGYSVRLIGCRYDIAAMNRFQEDGVDATEIPFGPRSGEVSHFLRGLAVLRLWLEILGTPARAYHAHNIHTGPPAWLAARLRRAALTYDAHELYGEPDSPRLLSRLLARASFLFERFMVRRSDAVITTNPSRVEVLRQRHGRAGLKTLANVPALVEKVEPLDPGYPTGAPVLLYQGGVYVKTRPFRETLQALSMVPEVEFVILGFGRDGDLELVRRWAEEAGVAERVHFLPPRHFEDLVHTAAAATLGLVPLKPVSLNSYLGDTNKLHEYLMAGVPVVASDVPEVRRVVEDGDPPVGELFDPGSPESIAAAIRRVLSDSERYEARRREARRLAVERHNWQTEERELLSLYGSLLPGHTENSPRRNRAING